MVKKPANKIEKRLFIYALALGIVIVGLAAYSFIFLSGKLLSAFSGDVGRSAQSAKFDTEGFNKLGL